MKKLKTKRALPSFAAVAALLFLSASAPADAPASASVSASASASVPASAPDAAEASSFEASPPGAEKSRAPSLEEWKSAAPVKLARSAAACRSYRVREWLKVRCEGFPAAGVSLLAGQGEGVMVWVDQANEGGNEVMKKPRPADVILPVRRGDGRILQIAQFGEGYDGPVGWNAAYTLSEQWVEGEAAPIIAVW